MNTKDKKDIRDYSLQELEEYFQQNGEKKFRAKQLYEWIWKKGVVDFSEMSNLALSLREKLGKDMNFYPAKKAKINTGEDGTSKLILSLFDGQNIESVLIPAENRLTACISAQSGCNLKCTFCASGQIKNGRNLTAGEIYDQISILNKESNKLYSKSISNIVFMGIGEPFLNYNSVIRTIRILTSDTGLNMSPSRITISTAGIIEKIRDYTDEGINSKLAISLHSANEHKRSHIMPVNKSNPLKELHNVISYYNNRAKNYVTLEYLLLNNFNDSKSDAMELVRYCKGLNVKINLIEYNPVANTAFKKTDSTRTQLFKKILEDKNMIVTIRNSRGNDISAACGQLANRLNSESL